MFAIRYSKQAVKAKLKMPGDVADRIDVELEKITKDSSAYKGDWKRLQGSPFWRLRIGSWRILCEVVKKELIITVLKIGSREDVYK